VSGIRRLLVPVDPVSNDAHTTGMPTRFKSDDIKPSSRLRLMKEASLTPSGELSPEKAPFEVKVAEFLVTLRKPWIAFLHLVDDNLRQFDISFDGRSNPMSKSLPIHKSADGVGHKVWVEAPGYFRSMAHLSAGVGPVLAISRSSSPFLE